ncbi:MAG: DUF927 domain-containing protein [Planctomycetota bacterium]
MTEETNSLENLELSVNTDKQPDEDVLADTFPDPEPNDITCNPYRVKPGHGFAYYGDKGEQPLTNFTARIVADVIVEEHKTITRDHEIEARLGDRVVNFTVSADELDTLRWVGRELGGEAIVEPGARKHVGTAIRRFSSPIPTRKLVTHTGWIDSDGQPRFVDATGIVGAADTTDNVNVSLPQELHRYVLPEPADKADLRAAVRDSLTLLDIGDPQVMVPLLAAAYRSVLGPTDIAVHLVGETGTYKSTLAGLVLSHFGQSFDRTNLPASWSSTVNALESMTWHAKDVLTVVDDYVPGEDRAETKAARLFRAQGNGNGRSRLSGGSRLDITHHPRGLILSTGEAVPAGRSIRARMMIVHTPENAVTMRRLNRALTNGAKGRHAIAMSGFIDWLSHHPDLLTGSASSPASELHKHFDGPRQHRRAANNTAQLLLGFQAFLRFAMDIGAVRHGTASLTEAKVIENLRLLTNAQTEYQNGGSGEVEKFLHLLRLTFHLKKAHLEHLETRQPQRAQRWGWTREWSGNNSSLKAHGPHIGWIEGGDIFREVVESKLYLIPGVTYKLLQSVAPTPDHQLKTTPRTLWRLLDDAGLLASTSMSTGRGRPIRKQINGHRHEVIHLDLDRMNELENEA